MAFTQQQLELAKYVPKGSAGAAELLKQGYTEDQIGTGIAPLTTSYTPPAPTPTPASIPTPTPAPTPSSYSGPSIVDYLNSVKQASDFTSRSKLATQYGISNYTGTAEQNTLLLNKLKSGSTPVPPAPIVPPAPVVKPSVPEGFDYNPTTNITTVTDKPKPTTGPVVNAPVNNQAAIDEINSEANDEQNSALDTILDSFGNVDTSKSTALSDKLLSTIEGVFNAPEAEKPQSLSSLFNSKKTELGIDKLETDLAGIDSKIKQLDADWMSQQEGEEGKLISTREISRNVSEAQVGYNRQRRDLIVEKDSIANQLNNKLNTLEMVMNFTNQDFTNSTNYYNQQYNKNLGLLNLVLNLEERKEAKQDKVKNEAQANLNTVFNLMDKQGIKWDSLSSSQKASISKLELSAGLPQGISALIAKSSPNLEIKATTSRTDTGGNVYYDVLMVDPKTNALTIKSIFRGKEEVKKEKPTEGDKTKELNQQMYQTLNGKKGGDGYVSNETWNSLRKGWIAEGGKAVDFDSNFSQFINPEHESDYFTSE